jgi:ankyrin repeat protein
MQRIGVHWVTALELDLIDSARSLIEAGADVNALDSLGRTPVAIAAFRNFAGMVAVLAEAGADLNARGGANSFAPIHFAAGELAVEATETLLARGVDPNARVLWGATPLGLAACAECEAPEKKDKAARLAEVLLNAGADPDATWPTRGRFSARDLMV